MNFENEVSLIKSKFNKDTLKKFDAITVLPEIKLASMGSNDTEGYQIFTPKCIVEQMVSAIGDEVLDFTKTILEPTSGDGAFTTYILFKRMETIKSDYEIEILKALSTIYSIEMDKELIEKQRNNIYTVIHNFIKEKEIEVDVSFFDAVKCVIIKNFIWAMFNSNNPIDLGLLGTEVAYKMPDAEKGNFKSLSFPVWKIDNDSFTYHEEDVDLW